MTDDPTKKVLQLLFETPPFGADEDDADSEEGWMLTITTPEGETLICSLSDLEIEGQRERFTHRLQRLSAADQAVMRTALSGEPFDVEAMWAQLENPLAFGKTLFVLEIVLKVTENSALLQLAARLLEVPGLYEAICRHDLWFPDTALVQNPHTDESVLRLLWSLLMRRFGEGDSAVHDLALHPNTPPDILEKMLSDTESHLNRRIAMHPRISTSIARRLLGSPNLREREPLARSHYVSEEIIVLLTLDEATSVREAALREYHRRHRTPGRGKIRPAVPKAQIEQARQWLAQFDEAMPPNILLPPAPVANVLLPSAPLANVSTDIFDSDDALLSAYRRQPDDWATLIRHAKAGPKLLRAGLLDGRDPRPSEYYQNRCDREGSYLAKLLPRGKGLYALARDTQADIVVLACLLSIKRREDPALEVALLANSRLRAMGLQALVAQFPEEWPYDGVAPTHETASYSKAVWRLAAQLSPEGSPSRG